MNKTCNFVIKHFNKFGFECYLVGGAVRDILMGVEPKDFDFATNARPKEILDIISGKQVGFATILTSIDGQKVEISTYRKREKYYADSRIPEVEFGDTIREDLGRRDFTINAMAHGYNKNDGWELLDPYNGQDDINDKMIRLTSNDESVLVDDPLRMLRAIRFVSQLGFKMDFDLQDKIMDNFHKILYVSRERWLMEMDKVLMGNFAGMALDYLVELYLASYLFPEIAVTVNMGQGANRFHHKHVWSHIKMVIANANKNRNLRWAALLHDLGKGATRSVDEKGNVHFYKHEMVSTKLANDICDRFKMSNRDRKEIVFLVANHMRIMNYNSEWKDSAVRRFVLNAGEYMDNLFALSRADITSLNPKVVEKVLKDVAGFRDRIANLKEEGKVELRLISREKFQEIVKASGLNGRQVGTMKELLERDIADGRITGEESVKDILRWYFRPGGEE